MSETINNENEVNLDEVVEKLDKAETTIDEINSNIGDAIKHYCMMLKNELFKESLLVLGVSIICKSVCEVVNLYIYSIILTFRKSIVHM